MDSCVNDQVMALARGVHQRRLYGSDHPRVQDAARMVLHHLTACLDAAGKDAFFLGVVDGKLVHDGRLLLGPTIISTRLAELAADLSCGGFLFRRGIELHEVVGFLDLGVEATGKLDLEVARRLLTSRNISHIELSPLYESADWFGQFHYDTHDNQGETIDSDPAFDAAVQTAQATYDGVATAHASACQGGDLDLVGLQSTAWQLMASPDNLPDLMQRIHYSDVDTYTVGHSVRVAMLSVLVGRRLGLHEDVLADLVVAAMLHDVGKAMIPDEILHKPGRLDAEERRVIETHAELGALILLASRRATPLAIAVAWGHHRQPDGRGYPHSSVTAVSTPAADLVRVCDVFEALTAVRPYKRALSARRAYEIMLQDSSAYSPQWLATFIQAVGLYPSGTEVRLSDGAEAVVTAATERPHRPLIRLTRAPDGQPVNRDEQANVDLSKVSRKLSITGCLADSSHERHRPAFPLRFSA